MIDLGTVKPGSTIRLPFDSFAASTGASSATTGLATSDIDIFKDGSDTERASTNGYTATADFNTATGLNLIAIDLADNTTAGFFAAGSEYHVSIDAVTIDTQTVRFWVARFRIGMPGAILDTTIATLSSQTSFTLTAGPAEDDALNGCVVYIHDVASAVQGGFAYVSDYTGSTKTVTLVAGTTFTAAATDNISVFHPVHVHGWLGTIAATPTVAGVPEVDLTHLVGVAQSATDLKDFADDGYDPATNKVQGLVLADAVTTVNGLAANVITAASIATGAIDADAIADNAIDAGAIADGAIDAATFAAGAITATVIATGAVDADALADGAITAATFAAGAITATVIATGAIDADALATDAIDEIVDAVWNEDATGHQTLGTFGQAIGDPVGDSTTIYQAVVTDAAGANIALDIVAVKAETASIQSDTNDIQTRLPAALLNGRMEANVAAISDDATAADNLETMLDGTGGQVLSLKQLNIVNSTGSALVASSTGSNGHGIAASGNGSGVGFRATGGATNGSGIEAAGQGAGVGLWAHADAPGTGLFVSNATGNACEIAGGTNGASIYGQEPDGYGLSILGAGTGHGVLVTAGATGHGVAIVGGSTSGDGLHISATDGDGIEAIGAGVGNADIKADLLGDITGNLSGSAGSVTGNVGGTINGLTAVALKDFFDTDSTTTYASAVAGSVVKEIADNAGGLTEAGIADAVWDEALAGHLGAGSTGAALNAAGAAGDPWTTAIPGAYGAGTAGFIVGTNLDATVSSRLAPTVASRTLDVTATGAAGVDWANVEGQTTAVNLSATNIDPDQVVASVTGAVGSVTGAVGSVTGAVGSVTGNVGGNVVGSVGSVAAGGITAASIATDAIDADAIAADAVTELADGLLKRDMSAVTGEASRSPLNALRLNRNKWSIAAGTLTVTKEDDTTTAWTAATATAASDPITSVDPT